MPTATLKYKLPEERYDFTLASRAADYHGAIYELANYMREITKYSEYKTIEASELAETVRTHFWSILNDAGIDPYDE